MEQQIVTSVNQPQLYTREMLAALERLQIWVFNWVKTLHEQALQTQPKSLKPFRRKNAYLLRYCYSSVFNIPGTGPCLPLTIVGRGKWGRVKKMVDTKGQIFAVKIIDIKINNDENYPDYLAEVDLLNRLGRLRGHGIWGNKAYIAMDYYEGVTVSKISAQLSLKKLLKVFLGMAAGVESLHRIEYLHNDIKEDNFIIQESLEIKIIDFGLSCSFSGKQTGGNEQYTAPECFYSEKRSTATDIYSLGMTYHSMQKYLLDHEDDQLYETYGDGKVYETLKKVISRMTSESPLDRPSLGIIIQVFIFLFHLASPCSEMKNNPLSELMEAQQYILANALIYHGANIEVYHKWHLWLEQNEFSQLHKLAVAWNHDDSIYYSLCAICVLQKIKALEGPNPPTDLAYTEQLSALQSVVNKKIKVHEECGRIVIDSIMGWGLNEKPIWCAMRVYILKQKCFRLKNTERNNLPPLLEKPQFASLLKLR